MNNNTSTNTQRDTTHPPSTSAKYTHSSSVLAAGLAAFASLGYLAQCNTVQAETDIDPHPEWQAGDRIDSAHKRVPTYTRKQISEHNTERSLWLSYRHGVYDLTAFANVHPGSVERLLLACQGNHDICAWWEQLGYHNVRDVHRLLEQHRIGNLAVNDVVECDVKPMEIDPILREHRSALNDTAFSYEPFIAETPVEILDKYYYTPAEYHYVRNHFKVPLHLDWDSTFTISGLGVPKTHVSNTGEDEDDDDVDGISLKYKDLLKLPVVEKDMYIQCGGHRRSEYNRFGVTNGSKWYIGAIGNGRYKGVLLRDVLKSVGVDVDALYYADSDYHVWLIGADTAPDGEQFGVSIPVYKALDPRGDVMLAFEYNGEALTPDHGYPVRVMVPGWVGARSVKWIEQIVISDRPCDLKSYTSSYRMTKNMQTEMRCLPVNSSITSPRNGQRIEVKETNGRRTLRIAGEAHSGDGRPIIRVDVSIDGGNTWNDARILGETGLHQKKWSWTRWQCDVDVSALQLQHEAELQIVCRAMDISHNRQPESCEDDLTFNPKGYSANPYHRVNVTLSFD